MKQLLLFALLGTGAGAVFAGLGMGLVTVHKGSGVINFAQASLGLWGAFVFDELHKSGDLVLPVVGVPGSVHLGTSTPLLLAAAIGILSSAALGVLAHVLVFRPLRHAPVLAQIMAAIGILTVLQSLIVRRFGTGPRVVDALFPQKGISFAGTSFPEDRLWLLGSVLLVSVVLASYYRWSLRGLATRAGVEDEVALALARWSPDRLAALNWAVGCSVTALFLELASPITGLNAASVGLLVVPGLAAMLVARLSSVTVAAAAGLGLGILQSELSLAQLETWWPKSLPSGTTDAVPFIIVIVSLVILGDRLPTRGSLALARLPDVVRRPLRLRHVLIASGIAVGVAPVLTTAQRSGLNTSMVLAIMSLSFVVLVGLVGQVSLGQSATAGIAAFTLARFTDGLPFPLSVLLASAVAVVAGVAMGIPALRVRGAQLAVVTLAGAVAVETLVLRNATPESLDLKSPSLFGLNLSVQHGTELARLPFTYAVLACLILCCLLVSRVLNGSSGRRFLAVRSNERAAAAIGIDVARTKVLAFAISSFLAGVAGALLAHSRGAVSLESFSYFAGITFLIFAFIGGITSVGGALVAGLLAPFGLWYVLVNKLVDLGSIYDLLGGMIMIATALTAPQGTAAQLARLVSGRRKRPAAPLHDPAPVGQSHARVPRLANANASGGLAVDNLVVSYGPVRAVNDVSLTVRPGQVHGLIGPNGAGKTSALDAVTGFCPSEGTIRVDGHDISARPAHRRHLAGLSRTWQATELFFDLSVLDNLLVASQPPRRGDLLRDVLGRPAATPADAAWALELLGIEHLAGAQPSALSTGQQKLVGVARALAARPAVLLCDEPAAGLDSGESRLLGRHLRAVADAGVAVVLIEHDLSLVIEICDEITVLDFGTVIAQGPPAEVRRNEAVLAAYVGQSEPPAGSSELTGDAAQLVVERA